MGVQAVPGLAVGVVVVLLLDDLLRRFEDVVVGRAVFPLLFGVSYELLALPWLLRCDFFEALYTIVDAGSPNVSFG